MTDPLGQSQVLPYLGGLSKKGHKITLLSFEKPNRYAAQSKHIKAICDDFNIEWAPQSYTSTPPVLSSLKDFHKMKKLALKLHREKAFDVAHARGYLPAMAGQVLQSKYGVKLLFDMRGFWPDERAEGGIWNKKNPVFNLVYTYFKNKERSLFQTADAVVSLTQAGKNIIQQWPFLNLKADEVAVIPCCADFDHFSPENIDESKKASFREALALKYDFVLSYLGSIGSWYMLSEMLDFFKVLLEFKPKAKMLFITPDEAEKIKSEAAHKNIDNQQIVCHGVARHDVPALLSLSDLSLFFIKPVFSKQASSPTKLAEILGMGIPAIANAGVGDVDLIYKQHFPDLLVHDFTESAYRQTLNTYFNGPAINQDQLVKVARQYFSLTDGIEKYHEIYSEL
ncbi:PEP-CTERM/exosortase A-associated glycosyltransferase, family [Salinivirga cyanobacteriivorans]|uniref:PEP-CTERM/exosortase A-associated glycosyltransferase, family n=2 Tax=Salinivirga cyanobacteriivorans TaxID=1307839 RepID=A0A0S2I0E5_9BACT|nr:PEP-CTERM/exosortase A-associated glycosyltransferase, family [Salinivirga cyanobacteriivorans]